MEEKKKKFTIFRLSPMVFIQWVITAGAVAGAIGYSYGIDGVCHVEVNMAMQEYNTSLQMQTLNFSSYAQQSLNMAIKHCQAYDSFKENCFYKREGERQPYDTFCANLYNYYGNLSWIRLNIS